MRKWLASKSDKQGDLLLASQQRPLFLERSRCPGTIPGTIPYSIGRVQEGSIASNWDAAVMRVYQSFEIVVLLVLLPSLAGSFSPPSRIGGTQRKTCILREQQLDEDDGLIVENVNDSGRRNLIINTVSAGLLAATGVATWELYKMEVYTPPGFRRLPTTGFLAALADPTSTEGSGADQWGFWPQDPGPRGVWLRDYDTLQQNDGIAPRGWKFNKNDFWVEEHGM